ncbi:MAG TPA: replication protein [Elusimicrobia bacterium]|nr:replication protein [Elusimicrobiota bacterium]
MLSMALRPIMRTSKIFPLILLAALAGCSAGPYALRRGADVYKDFAALKAANTEGLDYSREVYQRGSKVAVFAIHGGDIELATSRLARRTAGSDFNLYIFNGWKGGKSGALHVTSARFDDPDALRLAAASVLGISLHAQADRGAWVCVGGKNTAAARLVTQRLEAAGFLAETPCKRLPGVSDANIVNRPSAGGVQLELTLRLLSRLEKNEEELSKFSGALRAAAIEYLGSAEANVKQETITK